METRFRPHFVKKEFDWVSFLPCIYKIKNPKKKKNKKKETTAPNGAARSTWGKKNKKTKKKKLWWVAKSTNLTARLFSLSLSLSIYLMLCWFFFLFWTGGGCWWLVTGWASRLVSAWPHVAWNDIPRFRSLYIYLREPCWLSTRGTESLALTFLFHLLPPSSLIIFIFIYTSSTWYYYYFVYHYSLIHT